jgi:hypothetical protein
MKISASAENGNMKKEKGADLTDPEKDRQKLKGDQGTMDLPEVQDIPGQKNIDPLSSIPPGDTTISSADEEGDDVLGSNNNNAARITPLENDLLNQSFNPPYDADLPVEEISLDDRDAEGDRLEESGPEQDLFGEDLDDDLTEEEDEESAV